MNMDQRARQLAKTPEQRLLSVFEQEFEVPRRVAKEMVKEAKRCLFGDGGQLQPGQMRVLLVKRGTPSGRALREAEQVEVSWTIDAGEADREVERRLGRQELRKLRIRRLLDEALAQGGVATQEDLAVALQVTVRTIKRDCAALVEEGIYLPTRGKRQGIGRGQSHKAQVVSCWLNGQTYDQIRLHTRHSLSSIQRYVQTFTRLAHLHQQGYSEQEIALLLQIGPALVAEYLALLHLHDTPLARLRLADQSQRLPKQPSIERKKGVR